MINQSYDANGNPNNEYYADSVSFNSIAANELSAQLSHSSAVINEASEQIEYLTRKVKELVEQVETLTERVNMLELEKEEREHEIMIRCDATLPAFDQYGGVV